jgi:hypothetical protein
MELIQPMGRGATMALKIERLNPGVFCGSMNIVFGEAEMECCKTGWSLERREGRDKQAFQAFRRAEFRA